MLYSFRICRRAAVNLAAFGASAVVSLAIVAILTGVTTVATARALEPQIKNGTVVSAEGTRLVMKDAAGKQESFTVDGAAKITVNGKPGKLDDLQESMPIQVTTDEKGKVLAVSTVDTDKCPVPASLLRSTAMAR